MYAEDAKFNATEPLKWKFCNKHRIRNLSMQGEKLPADRTAAQSFVASFQKFMKEKNLSLD